MCTFGHYRVKRVPLFSKFTIIFRTIHLDRHTGPMRAPYDNPTYQSVNPENKIACNCHCKEKEYYILLIDCVLQLCCHPLPTLAALVLGGTGSGLIMVHGNHNPIICTYKDLFISMVNQRPSMETLLPPHYSVSLVPSGKAWERLLFCSVLAKIGIYIASIWDLDY